MRLLIVASEAMEFRRLPGPQRKMNPPPEGVNWVRTVQLGPHEATLVANGAGAARASAAVEAILPIVRPDALVSAGFCGALAPELGIADIVVATEVIDGGSRYSALPFTGPGKQRPGVVYTSSRVVQTVEERRALHAAGATVVDMEAAGVAERARIHALPFYCVKVVTDLAGESMANDFNKALRADGHFDTIILLQGMLRHPFARMPELLRLGSRAGQAARAMGEFFAGCRF